MSASLNSIDLFIIVLVFLLAFKGVFNGWIKELTSLIAIIGGVVVASRLAVPLAHWTEQHLFRLHNPAALELIAFLLLLLLIWGSVTLVGKAMAQNETTSPSLPSRTLGFFFAGIKYFLIFAIIISALSRTSLFREKFAPQGRSSLLYPLVNRTGSLLISLPKPVLTVKKSPHSQDRKTVPAGTTVSR